MCRRIVALALVLGGGISRAAAQLPEAQTTASPARAEFGEDQPWSRFGVRTPIAVYSSEGEPIPLDIKAPPSKAAQLAPAILALTPEEGLARLLEIAALDHVFTDTKGPEYRAAELDLLAALTAEVDPGGRTFARALLNCMRALEGAGHAPTDLSYNRPVNPASMYGSDCSPIVALLETQLTAASCQQIERDFGPWIEQGLREPSWGCVPFNRLGGNAIASVPLIPTLVQRLLRSGFASRELARAAAELDIESALGMLRSGDAPGFRDALGLLQFSRYGVLTAGDLNKLLAEMAPLLANLDSPVDRQTEDQLRSISSYLGVAASLPELSREQARVLLSLVSGADLAHDGKPASYVSVRARLLARFKLAELYPDGAPAAVRQCLAEDEQKNRRKPPPKAPCYVRVSTWRFVSNSPAECLDEAAFAVPPGGWTTRSWGEPVIFGGIAVRPSGGGVGWTFLGSNVAAGYSRVQHDDYGASPRDADTEPRRYVLERAVQVSLEAALNGDYHPGKIHLSLIEVDRRPPDNPPSQNEMARLLLDGAGDDYRIERAAFGWLGSSTEPFARDLLIETIRSKGDDDSARLAARALLSREDWTAFDGFISDLIKRPPQGRPPLLIAFEEATRPGLAPESERLRWTKAIIRTQITPAMHPENVQHLLDLCRRLGAPDFHYRADDSTTPRDEALSKARAWAG